ncbi:M48 family metallopeptidase [Rhodocyclaceae bacterium SMB388]
MSAGQRDLIATRVRLSRSLGVRALVCLLALSGLGGASIVLAAFASWHGIHAIVGADFAQGVLLTMLALVMLFIGATCGHWLRAPAPPPRGVLLPYDAAPSLHRFIERVGRHFGFPAFDAVWMTGDMNATVVQRPRWGWVGPMQTHLLLGLPLAHSLSDRQLAGVLAHEFGHLHRQRCGIGAWGCHLRAWWFRALDRIIEDLPGPLACWLDQASTANLADAMRLARLEEFEADHAAASVAGRHLIGEVLIEVALKERFLIDDYWTKVMAQSAHLPSPSIRPYREMGLGMAAGFRRPEDGSLPQHAAGFDPDVAAFDPHPPLEARLKRLGLSHVNPVAGEASVADNHLAMLLPTLALVFDRAWWADTRRQWRHRYRDPTAS